MTKNDPITVADRLTKARDREQRCAIILARRGTRHARTQMRHAMDALMKVQAEAAALARAAVLAKRMDSDLIAELHKLTAKG